MQPQRVIVAVKWGPLDGRKVVISPGEVVRVGRSERAGLVVPHDALMSAAHFEVSWDGVECRFLDLKSATGTWLNGEAGVSAGVVANGDWLKAGATVFTVHLEGATPAREAEDEEEGEESEDEWAKEARQARAEEPFLQRARAEEALAVLKGEALKEPLYALLDGARDKRILELLRESVEEYRSLYDGVQGEALSGVAPYLVRLSTGTQLLEALVREGWGRRWGIYLTNRQSFKEVRRHLRRFLVVEAERGEPLYFRFYDPRTLCMFLPTCMPQQREDFLGQVRAMFAETAMSQLERFESDASFPG